MKSWAAGVGSEIGRYRHGILHIVRATGALRRSRLVSAAVPADGAVRAKSIARTSPVESVTPKFSGLGALRLVCAVVVPTAKTRGQDGPRMMSLQPSRPSRPRLRAGPHRKARHEQSCSRAP